MRIWLVTLLLLCSGFMQAQAGDPVTVTVYLDQKQYLDGISVLERSKYFNLHSNGVLPAERGDMDRLALVDFIGNDLNAYYGRYSIGNSIRSDVPEDPDRPGYADPSWFQLGQSRHSAVGPENMFYHHPERVDLIGSTFAGTPDFMVEGSEPGADAIINAMINPEAFAEYMVLSLAYEAGLPVTWLELFNEPSFRADNKQLQEIYAAVARLMAQELPEIITGGPCNRNLFAFTGGWRPTWNNLVAPFMDTVGPYLDAYSFHSYDHYPADYHQAEFSDPGVFGSGDRDEAGLDLLANYSLAATGRVLPIFISEFGGYSSAYQEQFEGGPDATTMESEQIQNWYMLNSVNRKLMQYLNRPTTVLKVVPFIRDYHSWSTTYYNRILRPTTDGYRITSMSYFYRFWSDVSGCRVVTHTDNYNVQVAAFVHEASAYIVLDNFSWEEQMVDLRPVLGAGFVQAGTIRRLYLDVAEKAPVLTEPEFVDLAQLGSLRLRPHEKVVISMAIDQPVDWQQAVNEKRYYGHETLVPIEAGTSIHFQYSVDFLTEGEPVSAWLRLGIDRPADRSRMPEVTFNGIALDMPDIDFGSTQTRWQDYLGVRMAPIPAAALKTENELDIRFPDHGGYVTTAILVVNHCLGQRELGPYTQKFYEDNRLAAPFALLGPAKSTADLDPRDIRLHWQDSLGARWYRLVIAKDEGLHYPVVDRMLARFGGSGYPRELVRKEANSSLVDDLEYGRQYYWAVQAIADTETDDMKLERWNEGGVYSFTTMSPGAVPDTPVVSARGGFGSAVVQWELLPLADAYNIYLSQDMTGPFTKVARISDSSSWREMLPVGLYYVQVTGENVLGEGRPSQPVALTVQTATNVLREHFGQPNWQANWRLQGVWSSAEVQGRTAAHIRALFPRSFGSMRRELPHDQYQMRFRLMIADDGDAELASIRLTTSEQNNERYQVLYRADLNSISLLKRVGEENVLLAESSLWIEPGIWYQLQFSLDAGTLSLQLDEREIFSVFDQNPLGAGSFELYFFNVAVYLAHVEIDA